MASPAPEATDDREVGMDATYCTDPQCVEDECSVASPCCTAICNCALTENCWVTDSGDVFKDLDGTIRDVLYCTEHKTDWLK